MISVENALEIVASCSPALPARNSKLEKAAGLVLAQDVLSPIDMPPFRQSAMDGYAVHSGDGVTGFQVIAEIQAGSAASPLLEKGQAVRIFTGAMVPDSADTVIQQEIVQRNGDRISLAGEFRKGMNIRPQGEQIRKGEIALPKGSMLNPAAIGYLAALGITDVMVHGKPSVALLTTGNELIAPGERLKPGQIYESNSAMIAAALAHFHFDDPVMHRANDNLEDTQKKLDELIARHDVVLVSGGISVGDYDFVKAAFDRLGVTQAFYKVSQKPGKPIYFGTKGEKLVFGLPGNPASALTCFYVYVLPALQKLSGKPFAGLQKITRQLSGTYQKKAGLAHFLKCRADDHSVEILESQSSAMLNSFALANGLMYIPGTSERLDSGSEVVILCLDRQ